MSIADNERRAKKRIERFFLENGVTPETKRECLNREFFRPLGCLALPFILVFDAVVFIGLVLKLLDWLF